jgi:small subunit ribosomal protein S20
VPIEKSAFKELRKAKLRHLCNISTVSELKTLTNKFAKLVSEKKQDEAKKLLNTLISKLDKAASKGVIHKNNSSRKISRLRKKLSSLKA